jgi:hypothetical protein
MKATKRVTPKAAIWPVLRESAGGTSSAARRAALQAPRRTRQDRAAVVTGARSRQVIRPRPVAVIFVRAAWYRLVRQGDRR